MTERRPHWTDDLIEAVKDAISGWCFDHVEGPLYDDDVYPVIAAVEDWQAAQGTMSAAVALLRVREKLLDAEAVIERVRDACDLWQRRHDTSIRHPTDIPAIPITAVLRALDGER